MYFFVKKKHRCHCRKKPKIPNHHRSQYIIYDNTEPKNSSNMQNNNAKIKINKTFKIIRC